MAIAHETRKGVMRMEMRSKEGISVLKHKTHSTGQQEGNGRQRVIRRMAQYVGEAWGRDRPTKTACENATVKLVISYTRL